MANFSHYSGNVTIILSAGFNKGTSSDINWLLSSCTCCCCVIAQISFWSAWQCEQEALGSSDLSVRPTQHWALSTGNQGLTKLRALLPSPALVNGGQLASTRKRIKKRHTSVLFFLFGFFSWRPKAEFQSKFHFAAFVSTASPRAQLPALLMEPSESLHGKRRPKVLGQALCC